MSQSTLFISALAALSLTAFTFGGCNTFDPDLGAAPFRCGTGTPRCPDNYECVTHSAGEEICELVGEDPMNRVDAGGGNGTFTCDDDSPLEPNNSIANPTLTSIPSLNPSITLVQLAICPAGDQDFFRFDIEVAQTNALVQIEYDPSHGELVVEMVNGSGTSIGIGETVGDPGTIRVAVPNLAQGTYYGLVHGADATIQNNYKVLIQTVP